METNRKNRDKLGRFLKGFIPWNAGTKGLCHANSGTFKKGQKSATWCEVGTIKVRRDKSGARRYWIKIAEPNIWIERAKYVWLKSGKELIKGMVLHHLDGISSNDKIQNLILVSRAGSAHLHNKHNTKNFAKNRLSVEIKNESEWEANHERIKSQENKETVRVSSQNVQ